MIQISRSENFPVKICFTNRRFLILTPDSIARFAAFFVWTFEAHFRKKTHRKKWMTVHFRSIHFFCKYESVDGLFQCNYVRFKHIWYFEFKQISNWLSLLVPMNLIGSNKNHFVHFMPIVFFTFTPEISKCFFIHTLESKYRFENESFLKYCFNKIPT